MVDFDRLLETALSGAGRAFSEADADLNAIVVAANEAIRRHTKDAELALTSVRQGADGVLYSLVLLAGSGGGRTGPIIEGVLVPVSGYPIAVGALLDLQRTVTLAPGSRRELKDKAALEQHFAELFSDASSPLLQQIAYLTRRG